MRKLTNEQRRNIQDWKTAAAQSRESIARYDRMLGDPQLSLSAHERAKYGDLIAWYTHHAEHLEMRIRAHGVKV